MTLFERVKHVVALTPSGVIAIIIVVSLLQLIRFVVTLLVLQALNPLEHSVLQTVLARP